MASMYKILHLPSSRYLVSYRRIATLSGPQEHYYDLAVESSHPDTYVNDGWSATFPNLAQAIMAVNGFVDMSNAGLTKYGYSLGNTFGNPVVTLVPQEFEIVEVLDENLQDITSSRSKVSDV